MWSENLYRVVSHIASYSVLVPMLLTLLYIKTLSNSLRVLFIYLTICFFVDRITENMEDHVILNKILNSFTLIQFFFLFLIYRIETIKKPYRLILDLVAFLYLILAIKIFIIDNRFAQSDSIMVTTLSSAFLVITGLYFALFLLDSEITNLFGNYFFWINLSFFIYFGVTLLLFFNADFIEHCSIEIAFSLYSIHQIISLFCNILLSVGIWKTKKTLRS